MRTDRSTNLSRTLALALAHLCARPLALSVASFRPNAPETAASPGMSPSLLRDEQPSLGRSFARATSRRPAARSGPKARAADPNKKKGRICDFESWLPAICWTATSGKAQLQRHARYQPRRGGPPAAKPAAEAPSERARGRAKGAQRAPARAHGRAEEVSLAHPPSPKSNLGCQTV